VRQIGSCWRSCWWRSHRRQLRGGVRHRSLQGLRGVRRHSWQMSQMSQRVVVLLCLPWTHGRMLMGVGGDLSGPVSGTPGGRSPGRMIRGSGAEQHDNFARAPLAENVIVCATVVAIAVAVIIVVVALVVVVRNVMCRSFMCIAHHVADHCMSTRRSLQALGGVQAALCTRWLPNAHVSGRIDGPQRFVARTVFGSSAHARNCGGWGWQCCF